MRRTPGEVVVDVEVPEQRQVGEAGGEHERHQAGQDAQDHVRGQEQYIQGACRAEAQGAGCTQRQALSRPEANGHQARSLQRDDGRDQRCPEDERCDSGGRRQEEERDVQIGHDPAGSPGTQRIQHPRRRGRQHGKGEKRVGQVSVYKAAP